MPKRDEADELVAAVGGGTARNAAARPQVSLCYPPSSADGYSLIVDGTATVLDDGGSNDMPITFGSTPALA